MKVIKHDSNFGLDVRIWVRNSYLGLGIHVFRVMDATCRCKFLGLGQGTDPLYICPSQFRSRPPSWFRSPSPSQFRSPPPSQFRNGTFPFVGHKLGQPVPKQAGRLRNRLSFESGLNIYRGILRTVHSVANTLCCTVNNSREISRAYRCYIKHPIEQTANISQDVCIYT